MDKLVNKKKICIVGKGSIGVRHAKIFYKLKCKIFFLRTFKNLKEYSINFPVTELKKINKVEKNYFDLIVICNPTSLHFKTLKKLSKFAKNFLIEKPLIYKFEEYKKFKNFFLNRNINIFTGYYLRHDKRILKLNEIYKKNSKNVKHSKLVWKTYAPNWHREENFKYSYAGSKKLGGGVVNTCSHEIDLAIFLFGKVKKIYCKEMFSSLKTDVENSVIIQLLHENNILSEIILDFGSKYEIVRYLKIFFKDFLLKLNHKDKHITKIINLKKKTYKVKNFINNNQSYLTQNKSILKNLNKKMKYKEKLSLLHTEKIIQLIKLSLKNINRFSKYP